MIKDFECIKCGHCCKTIPMKKYYFVGIEVLSSDFLTSYDTPCPYFNSGLCSIYDKRPKTCRDYPCDENVAKKNGCKGSYSVKE